MKSVALLICWGSNFYAYNLVLASGNTFFVAQAGHLREFTRNDLSILFILKYMVVDVLPIICWLFGILFKRMGIVEMAKNWVTNFGFKRTDATVLKISIGMVCALICCILARDVEVQRLHLIKKEGVLQQPDLDISMSTRALIPQFLLLGVAEWLAEDGLKELFHGYASEAMRTFDESFSQLVIGVGKLLTIPSILIFGNWLHKSPDTSRFDKYYQRFAVLNGVFLLLFAFYYFMYAHKNEYPEDEENPEEEETVTGQTLVHAHHQADPEGAEPQRSLKRMKKLRRSKYLELAHQAGSEEVNVGELILVTGDAGANGV